MMEKPNILYHYTSVESLAVILSTKKFRLSPLSMLDDKQEEETEDITNIGKTIYVSSWTDDETESIPMWNMYSKMESGVRIRANAYMFEDDRCFNRQQQMFPYELKKVIYTTDENKLKPKIVSSDGMSWSRQEIGVYKNKVWEFQNEWRYIVRVWPGIDFDKEDEDAETIYNKFSLGVEPFIYLEVKSSIFENLQVTMSPKISLGNRIILNTLKEKYCPNMSICESMLNQCIR